jgi:hypothetical protein
LRLCRIQIAFLLRLRCRCCRENNYPFYAYVSYDGIIIFYIILAGWKGWLW